MEEKDRAAKRKGRGGEKSGNEISSSGASPGAVHIADEAPSRGSDKSGRSRERRDKKNEKKSGKKSGHDSASSPGVVHITDEAPSRGSGKSGESRERRDRDAKKRAKGRSRSPKRGATSVGAHSSADDRAKRKDDRNRHRSNKDGKNQNASASNESSAGASAATSAEDGGRLKGVRKGNTGEVGTSGTSVEDRVRRKEERNRARTPNTQGTESQLQSKNDMPTMEAFAVDERAENEYVRNLEAQMKAMKEKQNQPPAHTRDAEGFADADHESTNDNHESFLQRNKVLILVALVMIIAGGLAGYFLNNRSVPIAETAPSTVSLNGPPSEEDCERISSGTPLPEQDNMITESVKFTLDVTLLTQDRLSEATIADFLYLGIKDGYIPSLVGCTNGNRLLRNLQASNSRYVVANALVNSNLVYPKLNDPCKESRDPLCSRSEFILDLFLKEEHSYLLLLLADVFGQDGIDLLGLDDKTFKAVSLSEIQRVTSGSVPIEVSPSPAPTSTFWNVPDSPVETPSLSQAPSPGAVTTTPLTPLSSIPTRLPSPQPSLEPSMSPSASPSFVPSKSPTEYPSLSPTAPPVVDPTPLPTQRPTPSPTPPPTPPPTRPPTFRPTPSPTLRPITPPPTFPPTPPPTFPPTPPPTFPPTFPPTPPPPTPPPTPSPTACPSTCSIDLEADANPTCWDLRVEEQCESSSLSEFMSEYCQTSCGYYLCANQRCDWSDNCAGWKAAGHCDGGEFQATVLEQCACTCRGCPP